jgi:hypothetical protein
VIFSIIMSLSLYGKICGFFIVFKIFLTLL